MKITYTPNPLDTIVELEPHEVELLRLKIKLKEYEEMIFSAHFTITDRLKDLGSLKARSLEEAVTAARDMLDPKYWCSDGPSELDARVEELLQHYMAELKGSHCGDCTCVPMSCSKCHAEELLGIDTLRPFPGKGAGFRIASVFSRWNPATKQHDQPEVSLDDAIQQLAAYKPSSAGPAWEPHAERWNREAKAAHDFLVNYRNQHFTKE